jgi:hypothetical protein
MQTSPQPSIGEIIDRAFRDALPVMRSRTPVYGVLAAIAALGGLFLPFAHAMGSTPVEGTRLQLALQPPNVLGAIAIFFVIPTVARTVRPEFRMTVGRVFGLIGIAIAIGVVVEVGFLLLIVPGVYMAVKWSQAQWAYLLGEGKNPFGESFEMTKGHFWHTLGFSILLALAAGVVLAPIALLGYIFAVHVAQLGSMRWMLALRALHADTVAPVPAPAV